MASPTLDDRVVAIAPPAGFPWPDVRDAWSRRGLLGFLVLRDLKVRYAQTALGVAGIVIQPMLAALMWFILFGRIARMPSDGVPYAAFALSGVIIWSYCASATTLAASSLVDNASLVSRVFFPRLLLPVSSATGPLVDATIAIVLLSPVLVLLGAQPRLAALATVPLALAYCWVTTAALGCMLAALNVRYRDVKQLMGFAIQGWLFASPVVYPLSVVPERYHLAYALNPLVSAVQLVRFGLLGTPAPPAAMLAASAAGALLLLLVALVYFRLAERTFVDVA